MSSLRRIPTSLANAARSRIPVTEAGEPGSSIAAHWPQRRAWAIEARLPENEAAAQPGDHCLHRMANAFASLAAKPLRLIHRYETRRYLHYQRSLHNILLRAAAVSSRTKSGPL